MAWTSRFARGHLKLTRMEALSDGVFAIIVTLLVLELRVPGLTDTHSVGELQTRLAALMPKFLSWLISFIIVCKFWLNHHHVLNQATHANYGLVWLNSMFLMFQSFIPFPTALMGEYPRNPLAVSFFGTVLALNTLLFIALHAYVRRRLLRPEWLAREHPHIIRKSFVGPVFYLVGAACAWWSVQAAFAAYLLTPLFFLTPAKTQEEGKS